MKNKFSKKNSEGFSLLEVMVAIGIMGVISYGVVLFISNTNSSTKSAEAKLNELSLVRDITTYLLDQNNCNTVFQSKAISDSIDSIGNFAVNKTIGSGSARLRITSIKLLGASVPSGVLINNDLELIVSKEGLKHKPTIKHIIPLSILWDNNKVLNCYSAKENTVALLLEEQCNLNHGTFNKDTLKCSDDDMSKLIEKIEQLENKISSCLTLSETYHKTNVYTKNEVIDLIQNATKK